MTAGTQYAHRLAESLASTGVRRNVVDGKATDDDVDALVLERQLGHVGGVQLNAVGDVLQFCVCPGGRWRVVGLVGLPEVNADGTSTWQPLGRGQQHCSAATSHIE